MTDSEKLIALIVAWVFPALFVVLSGKTRGFEKVFWTFITVWGSWITYGFYWLIAPITGKRDDAAVESDDAS